MSDRVSEPTVSEPVGRDFLFTWKEDGWPYDELRNILETFRSAGAAELLWRCAAHKQVRPGDRAYLLKQGKPIGIFGRAAVVGKPEKNKRAPRGENQWRVPIRFEASEDDVLWDPLERFLVDEKFLRSLPVSPKQWQNQASGISLDSNAARAIDGAILDSILVGRGETGAADDIAQEAARRRKLIEHLERPDQQSFSETIRKVYQDKCAVTGCVTRPALQAAHIKTQKGVDDNSPTNGILLRADVHALFDSFLITLSEDGRKLEVSPVVTDPSYAHLRNAIVVRPNKAPSAENIRHHRELFFEKLRFRNPTANDATNRR